MKNHRHERIAELLREELTEILLGEAANPELQRFRVVMVEPANDLSSAKVFVAPSSAQEFRSEVELRRSLKSLRQAQGFIRHLLSQRGELRRVPELHFEIDRGVQHGERIDTLLERIKKRSKKQGPLAILILCALFGVARGSVHAQDAKISGQTELERYEASATIMGSVCRVAAYGPNRGKLASAIQAAFEEARRLDRLLSNYKPDSELSRINQAASDGPVTVSREMADLLGQCVNYSRESEGAFDITVGPLMKVWGFYRGEGKIPSRFTLWRTVDKIGYNNLDVDAEKSTVAFRSRGVELDPGGIGKGYAVDRMVEVLRRAGIEIAMVSAGGSSMYGMGRPPEEPRGWHVRIRDPKEAAQTAAEIYLADESMSTSGTYEKFFEVEDKVYSHIMDPRTGMPAEGVLSVSVVAPKTIDSEAWTKGYFVNGRDWTRDHIQPGFRVLFCSSDGACEWMDGKR